MINSIEVIWKVANEVEDSYITSNQEFSASRVAFESIPSRKSHLFGCHWDETIAMLACLQMQLLQNKPNCGCNQMKVSGSADL